MKRFRRNLRTAMTLVELLVVLAIIGALISLLLPALQAVCENTRRIQCANNLRQMGVAAGAFCAINETFPASWVGGDPSVTWARSLLPHLDQQAIADRWNLSIGYLDGANAELAATPIPVFKCPSSPSPEVYEFEQAGFPPRYGTNDYKGCQGANGSDPAVKHWNRPYWVNGVVSRKLIPRARIRDGITQTILLVESTGGDILYGPDRTVGPVVYKIWYATDGAWIGRALSSSSPTRYDASGAVSHTCSINCSNAYDQAPFSFHGTGAMVVLCDASARYLDAGIDPATILGLYSYDDGQILSGF